MEAVVQVKISGRIVDCVNQDCPNAYQIGGLRNSRECIAKERLAKPFSLLALVYC